MTGIVYGMDPSTWNVNNWNGIDPVTLSILGAPLGELTVSTVPEPATLMIALVIAGSA